MTNRKLEQKRGPGSYAPTDDAIRKRAPAVLAWRPAVEAPAKLRLRRNPEVPTPGPGAYSICPSATADASAKSAVAAAVAAGGVPAVAPWSRQMGRDAPTRSKPTVAITVSSTGGTLVPATVGGTPTPAPSAVETGTGGTGTSGGVLGLEVKWEVVKPRIPNVSFGGSLPRIGEIVQPRGSDGVPLYFPSHALVKRRPLGGAMLPSPSSLPRHTPDIRASRAKAILIDLLLRGGSQIDALLPRAFPADALRRSVVGFKYLIAKAPQKQRPVDRHRAVAPGTVPLLLQPNYESLFPRNGTAYIGPGAGSDPEPNVRSKRHRLDLHLSLFLTST